MERVRKCLANDRFARHCGIELESVSAGQARAKLKLEPLHWNGVGIAQGGAIFTLADYAFAAASNSHGNMAVGINTSISFLKAVTGGTLYAEAKEMAKNFKLGLYVVEVRDDEGDLVALFQGMVYRKKEMLGA